MIAMALVHNPAVLIADEPTTALDVTVQAQILELIDKVKRDFDIGVILITHDLGVVAETAQTVMVMYAGRAVEHGPAREVFARPQHPYTWGLLESMPSDRGQGRATARDRGLAALRHPPARRAAPSIRAARTASSRATRSGRRSSPWRAGTSDACHLDPRPSAGSGPSARPCDWGSAHERTGDADHRGRGPDQALPGRERRVRTRQGRGACGRGRVAERAPGRDARHRRRVRLRQVDDGAADAQAARADAGTIRSTGATSRG